MRVDCALRIGRVGQLIGGRLGEWATEQISLSLLTADAGKEICLRVCFDAFGCDRQREAPSHRHDRIHDGGGFRILLHAHDERLIVLTASKGNFQR